MVAQPAFGANEGSSGTAEIIAFVTASNHLRNAFLLRCLPKNQSDPSALPIVPTLWPLVGGRDLDVFGAGIAQIDYTLIELLCPPPKAREVQPLQWPDLQPP
ncbi:MAG: hypothetical protein ACI9R3_005067 [Verrucomicrobiales bacterium]|jgi:hypothetical protein